MNSENKALFLWVSLGLLFGALLYWGIKTDAVNHSRKLTADGNTVIINRDGFGHPRVILKTISMNGCDYVAVIGVAGNEGQYVIHSANCKNPAHTLPK